MTRLRSATDTLKELLLWLSLVLGAATVGYAVFEHESLWDSFWWAIVTGATVGYGDEFPDTIAGRAVGIALIVCCVFLVSLLTARMATYMIVHNDAFTDVEQEQIKADLTEVKADLAKVLRLLESKERELR
ncbi:two pore domain potassium channel family protein [Mycolicibacterium sp. S2-37]|uniref:potassium channel family protein n=1 Tax=Mycolicibacterium sp. S2-37 TaxID=2810297 RepID=UPI001A942554|nr:potassium channel family protein [Mycolicibacterium sp. S2-37]MBO0676919.1 two pore domain potassium channel family protein [Mycolicibacterium sp. S2-37]